MKLIDTHCHIQFDAYRDDGDEVLQKCKDRETGLLVVGCDFESSTHARALADRHQNVWAAVGQHPTDTGLPFDPKEFLQLAHSSKKVVAVGECGLDYYRIRDTTSASREELVERQKALFRQHLDLAHDLHLPLIIHCRHADDDLIAILMERFWGSAAHGGSFAREHGVMHCFTGTVVHAQAYLDLGFLISFTGIITFADQYDDVVRMVPLDKLLIETDSPFLTPLPHRGKRNHPMYVELVARQIARLRGISYEEVARATTQNAKRLFRL